MRTPDSTGTVEQRLEKLEHQLTDTRRSLRRAHGFLTIAGIAALGLLGAAAADMASIDLLQVKRMEIIDAQGNVVMAASGDANGGRLDVWKSDGCNALRIGANANGGDVALWNCQSKTVAGLFASESGGELAIWDNNGGRSARIHDSGTGGSIELLQASKPRAQLAATINGGMMGLMDLQGQPSLMANSKESHASLELHHGLTLHGHQDGGQLSMGHGTDHAPLMLSTGDDGEAGLTLNSSTGGVSIAIGDETMPPVEVHNTQGESVATMTLRDTGGGSLSAAADDGTAVASLRADAMGNGRIDLSDQTGTLLATMQTLEKRGATLALMGPNQKPVCAMAASGNGGALNLSNAQGVPIVVAGMTEGRRDGAISIFNQRGIPVLTASNGVGGAGQLTFNDDNGTRVLELPQRYDTNGSKDSSLPSQ